MKLGLAAIDALCEKLGRPEKAFPSVLIGGTNGKGSVAATLSAIAAAHGLRAGLYTSPHLARVTERIRLEEKDVSEDELDEALGSVFDAADRASILPTYFEAATAAAFLLFARRRVDLAILEVGLGGRFDATNIAPAVLSAVTSIALDHTAELGTTLAEIAREKAGIFRRGRPALVHAAAQAARESLLRASREAGAVWHDAALEIEVEVGRVGLDGTRFAVRTPERRVELATPLPGAHQAWNTALAVRAAELLAEPSLTPRTDAIVRGVERVRWPGRLECLGIRGRTVLLDGCHNPEGAESLARFLADAGLEGRCPLVFGAMADKDIEGIARVLFPRVTGVTLVTVTSTRAAAADELARRVPSAPGGVRVASGFAEAMDRLLAGEGSAPIIVAGSLYLVGEARSWLLAGGPAEGCR